MQELISFIAIMLGVVVLTAWVVWLLLRPSGNEKVEEFASKASRDGMTQAAMENNELKNKIARLEREIKVLMSAGYKPAAEMQEEGGETKDEVIEVKDDRPKSKGQSQKAEDKRRQAKINRKKAEDEKRKSRENLLKIKELEAQIKENEARVKAEAEAKAKAKVDADAAAAEAIEIERSPNVVPLSEAQRIIDAAEKKKIADYMASVEETSERHKKEVEALENEAGQAKNSNRNPDDDLKKIKGIGTHLENQLKNAGICSYRQIADFDDTEIQRVSKLIGSYPRRIRREEWVEQASRLLRAKN